MNAVLLTKAGRAKLGGVSLADARFIREHWQRKIEELDHLEILSKWDRRDMEEARFELSAIKDEEIEACRSLVLKSANDMQRLLDGMSRLIEALTNVSNAFGAIADTAERFATYAKEASTESDGDS